MHSRKYQKRIAKIESRVASALATDNFGNRDHISDYKLVLFHNAGRGCAYSALLKNEELEDPPKQKIIKPSK